MKKSDGVPICPTLIAFCDIARDTNGRTPNLISQSKISLKLSSTRYFVYFNGELFTLLPYLQVSKPTHNLSPLTHHQLPITYSLSPLTHNLSPITPHQFPQTYPASNAVTPDEPLQQRRMCPPEHRNSDLPSVWNDYLTSYLIR